MSETTSNNSEPTVERTVGRNEPCPCRSGKKYKRCCGVNAAPKLSAPAQAASGPALPPGMENMDPQAFMPMMQALQRLPKGQLQRLQALMQKAMAGKDVSREAQEFERTLPAEFQSMMRNFQMPGVPETADEMTPEKAREIVAQAAAQGQISTDQAEELLSPAAVSEAEKKSGISKLFKFNK